MLEWCNNSSVCLRTLGRALAVRLQMAQTEMIECWLCRCDVDGIDSPDTVVDDGLSLPKDFSFEQSSLCWCWPSCTYLRKQIPFLLGLSGQATPLLANDFGYFRIRNTRILRYDTGLLVLAKKNKCCYNVSTMQMTSMNKEQKSVSQLRGLGILGSGGQRQIFSLECAAFLDGSECGCCSVISEDTIACLRGEGTPASPFAPCCSLSTYSVNVELGFDPTSEKCTVFLRRPSSAEG